MKEEPGKPMPRRSPSASSDKRLLLLLDNCEHLLDACAGWPMRSCGSAPACRSWRRSREALGIAGEQTYRVPSLSLPDPSKRRRRRRCPSTRRCSSSSNARCWSPGFPGHQPERSGVGVALPPARRHPAGHRVGGSAGALALGRGDRRQAGPAFPAADRRHAHGAAAPADAALAHRLELRPAERPEKPLLQRLSVFAGGWTLEAAERLRRRDVENEDVLDLLTSLADKSLVLAEQTDGHRATGCWRRCGSTRGRGWRKAGRRSGRERHATTSWRWRRRRSRN